MFTEFSINRIAVPTDFSEAAYAAMKHAIDLAARFNADIRLVHVLETGAYQGIFSASRKSGEDEKENARKKLEQDAHRLEGETGISVSHIVSTGRISDEIIEVVRDYDADMIVMGTHGIAGWAEFFVGSNAFKVVTQSPCPVLTVQSASDRPQCEHIILPVDRTQETRQKVPVAAAMAKKFDATIHIATLLADDTPDYRHDFKIKVKQITDYLDREGIAYTETILTGSNLATMTMNFAESKDGNLIIMMTEQESNMTGFLMGPYAQQVVNHSKIPVLSISPEEGEGFSFT